MSEEFNEVMNEQRAAIALRKQDDPCELSDRWKWVDRYREADLPDREQAELQLILKQTKDPDQKVRAAKRVVDLCLDNGNLSEALNFMKVCVALKPRESIFHRSLGQLLDELGDSEAARAAYRAGYEATGDLYLLRMSKPHPETEETEEETDGENNSEVEWPHTMGDAIRFLDLFSGREGVHARQWASPSGESGYTPVREPITPHLVMQHFSGRQTLGVYQLTRSNEVTFIAFDVDGAIDESAGPHPEREAEPQQLEAAETVAQICQVLSEFGIAPVIEESGGKGFHVWIFLDTAIKASTARKFGSCVTSRIPPMPHVTIEVFPKQSIVREGGLGNLIKLPLGVHQKTRRFSRFLEQGMGIPDSQREFLHSIVKTPRGRILKAINVFSEQETNHPVQEGDPITPHTAADARLHSTAGGRDYLPETDAQLQRVLSGCELLRTLYARARGTGRLTGDEKTVLIHTLGHLPHGPSIVNPLLEAGGVPSDQWMKRGHRGYPMGCAKIKKRLPQLAAASSCNCQLDESSCGYAHPLLHLERTDAPSSLRGLGMEQLVLEYMKVRREMTRLDMARKALEQKLYDLFDAAGTESISLVEGTLRIGRDTEGNRFFSLELG